MQTITRKTLLYPTKVEYGDYAMNHTLGCAHGCTYPCYAYLCDLCAKRFKKINDYKQWCEPRLVSNTLELLDKELKVKHKTPIKNVHLCFTTDPFMFGYPEICKLSVASIKKLNSQNIPCTVLTKGCLPKSLIGLSRQNTYGITLVSLSSRFHAEYEPNTAPVNKRISALKNLHDAGCSTWVSIEPYPTSNIITQDLDDILPMVKFVDRIVFGKMNYNLKVNKYKQSNRFYKQCVAEIRQFCYRNNIDFHVKEKTEETV